MGLMDKLRNLFRSGAPAPAVPAEAVEYKGYRITPAPERQPSGWNTAGLIAKTFEDGV
ncbi:MAG: Transcriptional activator HlyU, partial [Geminicoccaceae bacterium]|nr:Transcriptional activator HlyU [Geminicoccaceae bacterium]